MSRRSRDTIPLFPQLARADDCTREHRERERSFRAWAQRSIRDAETRQRQKAEKGRPRVRVTVTVDQLMAKLRAQNYCCQLSGFRFRTGDGGTYGPTIPSLDRLDPDGNYSDANVRIVCLGFNGLRGRGSEEQMYEMAAALLRRRGYQVIEPANVDGREEILVRHCDGKSCLI